jgi:transposase-like protein
MVILNSSAIDLTEHRIMREIRQRSRVVGCFPDGNSALMLAAARLRYIAGTKWGSRRYLNMKRLEELEMDRAAMSDKKSACPMGRQWHNNGAN